MGKVIKVEGNIIYVDFQSQSQTHIDSCYNNLALAEE